MSGAIHIVDPSGKINSSAPWFAAHEQLGQGKLKLVAALGSQGSGRSTLVNSLFNTNFEVGVRGKIGQAITKGIVSDVCKEDPRICVLDVEAPDARERGKQGKIFARRCLNFVIDTCDVVLINIWSHDAARLDSVGYALLSSLFEETSARIAGGVSRQTALMFVLRDVEGEDEEKALSSLIRKDAEDMWDEMTTSAGLPVGGDSLSEYFELSIVSLPHIRYEREVFDKKVQNIREHIVNGDLDNDAFSRDVDADGFPTFSASVWDSQVYSGDGGGEPGSATRGEGQEDGFYAGEDFSVVAAYKCDEVFSDLLTDASKEVDALLKEAENKNKIPNLGAKSDRIITSCMQHYESETAEFAEEPVHARKRRELEAIVDTGLLAVYMKQIQLIREDAVAAFKAQLSDDMPDELALFTAHSQFIQAAREAKRPDSTWSCEAEEADLHNMLSELSQQHRKLMSTKMTASQNSAKAMQFLQMQHAQVQAIQQQALGGAVGQWNAAAVYRPPDTNVNISLGYQQGRTNLQVSMVPDESASLLGPSGFTAGVGPANVGLSFNINM